MFFCIGVSISIGREIQCLPYAGFRNKIKYDLNKLVICLKREADNAIVNIKNKTAFAIIPASFGPTGVFLLS